MSDVGFRRWKSSLGGGCRCPRAFAAPDFGLAARRKRARLVRPAKPIAHAFMR